MYKFIQTKSDSTFCFQSKEGELCCTRGGEGFIHRFFFSFSDKFIYFRIILTLDVFPHLPSKDFNKK